MGNGVSFEFTYPNKFLLEEDLTVIEVDDEGAETELVLDTDYQVTGMGEPNGGEVNLITITPPLDPLDPPVITPRPLPSGHRLVIVGIPSFVQPFAPLKDRAIPPESAERAWDRLVLYIQRLRDLASRSLRLKDSEASGINMELPGVEGSRILATNQAGTALELRSFQDLAAEAGSGLPPGGDEYNLLERDTTEGQGRWVPVSYQGYTERFDEVVDLVGQKAVNDFVMKMGHAPPTVSFTASGSNTLRERGDAVTSVDLDVSYTKQSEDITEIRFYYDNTLIHTVSSPNPTGGSYSHTWTGSFDSNKTFRVEIDTNGHPIDATQSRAFSFVYPYYVGAGSAGLSAASVAGLTKRIIQSSATRTETIAASNGNVFYFAYPASYGALVSILDVNNFETIGDWTLRTENITGLDGNPVSYRIYEFNNPVTAGSYQYTFKR